MLDGVLEGVLVCQRGGGKVLVGERKGVGKGVGKGVLVSVVVGVLLLRAY